MCRGIKNKGSRLTQLSPDENHHIEAKSAAPKCHPGLVSAWRVLRTTPARDDARGARRRDARVREVDARGRRARSTRAAARAERGAGGVWRGEEEGATNRRGWSLRIEVDAIDPDTPVVSAVSP